MSYGKTSAVQWCSKALQSGSYIVSDFEGFRAPKHNVVGKSKKGSLLRSFMLESGGAGRQMLHYYCRHYPALSHRSKMESLISKITIFKAGQILRSADFYILLLLLSLSLFLV